MAAKSKALLISGGGNGKRVLALIPSLTSPRKGVHTSSYDKNIDEAIAEPNIVPEHVIGTAQPSETYWGPHPQTGVFGPPGSNSGPSLTTGALESTVLDQKVRFRPLELEDVEKPIQVSN